MVNLRRVNAGRQADISNMNGQRDGTQNTGPAREPREEAVEPIGVDARTVLKLVSRRTLRFRFMVLWLREGNRMLQSGCHAKRPGGSVEADIEVEGNIAWKPIRTPSGESRVGAWMAGPVPPRITVRTCRWPQSGEALLRILETVTPEEEDSREAPERLRELADRIMAASQMAAEDALSGHIARAWRLSDESTPFLECVHSSGMSEEQALARLGDAGSRAGFSGLVRDAIDRGIEIEVYMPVLTRTAARNWAARAGGWRVGVNGCGVVRVHEDTLEAQSLLLAAGGVWGMRREGLERGLVSFEHRQQAPAEIAKLTVPAMLDRYGLRIGAQEWLAERKGEITVRVQVSAPASTAPAWVRMPGEKRAAFFEQFIEASRALHESMRHWVPYLYFQDAARFEEYKVARAVLAYGLTTAMRKRETRTVFTYDILDPGHLSKAVGRILDPLGKRFAEIRRLLLDQGRPIAADAYMWRWAGLALKQMKDMLNRPFATILQGESQVVNAFLTMAVKGPSFPANPRQLFESAGELAHTLELRLKRLLGEPAISAIAPLLIAEATRALSAAQGNSAPLEVVVRLSEDNGPEYVMALDASANLD
jgi:hypothetical protein